MKLMVLMIVALSLSSTTWAQGQHTQTGRKSEPMQTMNDITMVAPALEKYAQGPLADLWKRPGLTPRDRSIVTIAALIARNQTIEMPHYFNLALDNGVKPREISEIITHLAFYSGWENAMSAVAVAKLSLPIVRSGPISFLQLRLRPFPSIRRRRQNAQPALNNSSVVSLRASCSTPLTFCSGICGCVRTLRLEIGAW